MIKINLSPDKKEIKIGGTTIDYGKIPWQKYMVSLFIGLIPYVALNLPQIGIVDRMKRNAEVELEKVQKIHAELAKERGNIRRSSGELESLMDGEKELQKKLEVLKKLTSSRRSPIRQLQEVAYLIPSNAWLSSLTLSNQTLSLEGSGATLTEINKFFNSLNESTFFQSVVLKDIVQSGGFQKFKIELRLSGKQG